MKLLTAAQMREVDRRTIEEWGITGATLMEKAGCAIALDVAEHFPTGRAVVLCGKGNNGGDGFVAARYLANAGWAVTVVYTEPPSSGDPNAMWNRLPESVDRRGFAELADPADFLREFDIAIDALLGTGTSGRPRPPFDALIEALNSARLPVFSADIPSGLHPDDGTAELAVRAFRTITMGRPKIGMVRADGPVYTGTVRVEELDFPQELFEAAGSQDHTMTMAEAAALLPPRPRDAHKGTFGLLLLAAGSVTMPGAAVLAAEGALRGGCGLVRLVSPRPVARIAAGHHPEILLSDAPTEESHLVPLPESLLNNALEKATALAIGPGIGTFHSTSEFLAQLLDSASVPAVLDADALNLIARDRDLRNLVSPNHILTPHPGEISRLLSRPAADIQADRWRAVREAAAAFHCVVLLKGAGTLVAEPGGEVTHIPSGNTAWSRGGAGDVLTGLLGSLLAQGLPPYDAARLGAFVHGISADVYTEHNSSRGATTRDLAACLPKAFRRLEDLPQ